jgi:hypothetical protein
MLRTAPALGRQYRSATVEPLGDRQMRFVASDETVDRYGDVIVAKGWQLDAFKTNPVLLLDHQADAEHIVGNVTDIQVTGKRLIATATIADFKDDPALKDSKIRETTDTVWALLQNKILRAVSVGFTVNSYDDIERILDDEGEPTGGVRYLKPELLELSIVAIPANPNALALSRSLEIPETILNRVMPFDAVAHERRLEYRRRFARLKSAGVNFAARPHSTHTR